MNRPHPALATLCALLALPLLPAACGEDPVGPDAGKQRTDAAEDAATLVPADSGTAPDAAPATPDASISAGEDAATAAGEDAAMAAGEDAASAAGEDAGAQSGLDAASPGSDAATSAPDAGAARPRGQCNSDSNCPAGYTCVASAPGGFCNGCMTDCGLGFAYECFSGGCSRSCSTDDECPAGLRCATSAGRCGLLSCGSCPAPYTCQGGFCRRPPCPNGVGDCPAGWGCAQGYCDEP